MEILITKHCPVIGVKSIEIFRPYAETPNTYLFNLDGELFSYRTVSNLIFIGGDKRADFNKDMISIIRTLLRKVKQRKSN